jgi:hypothetical protein
MKSIGVTGLSVLLAGMLPLLAAVPSSTNYTLRTYDIGSGGGNTLNSTNYKLNAVSGTQSGTTTQTSTNFVLGDGITNATNSNVPPAPAFTNPSSYYDRLLLVLNAGSNPTDTKFLIAISSDNFVTTSYVQADHSVGTSQALANYQTYAAWGGGSGFLIVGLQPSTTYAVKVKALQGDFTGSAFGPTATAATVAPSLTYSLSTTLTATPPFAVDFTSLPAGSVVSGAADAQIGLTSNASNGGTVYIKGANGGLTSASAATTITSASADLSVATSGYGAQVTASGQASGGPLTSQSPYNGATNNVGNILTSLQPLITSTGPVTTGTATIRFKAKSSSITPSASDYADTVTIVVAMNY